MNLSRGLAALSIISSEIIGGCTPSSPEDVRDVPKAPPISDISDGITEGTVADIHEKCSKEGWAKGREKCGSLGGWTEQAAQEGIKATRACLAKHGLSLEDESQ